MWVGPLVVVLVAPSVGGSVDDCCDACLSRSVDVPVPSSVGWLVRERQHFVQNTGGRKITIKQLNSNKIGQTHQQYVDVPFRVKESMAPTYLQSDIPFALARG